MDPKSAQAGAFSVRGNLCRIMESREMRQILDRFHERLCGMSAGVSIDSGRVKIEPGAKTERSAAPELVIGHMLGALRFEGLIDSDFMLMAADVGRELNARRAEIMSSQAFLAELGRMLEAWENADDPVAVARLCLGVFSATGANPRMASMAEIDNPMMVIELTKSYVSLLIAQGASTRPPDNDNSPSPEQPHESPAQAKADAGGCAAAPQPDVAAPAPQTAESKPPLAVFEDRLRGLGASEHFIESILASPAYARDPEFCVKMLDKFVSQYGREFTLIAIHKNRALLIGQSGSIIGKLQTELKEIAADTALLGRYSRLLDKIERELGIPRMCGYPVLSSLRGSHLKERMAIENLDLLVSRVPKDKLRFLALASPHSLATGTEVQRLLDEHKQSTQVDSEALISEIMAAQKADRPEAFVRAYVLRNLDSMSSRSLAIAVRKIDYAGRSILIQCGNAGVPDGFIRECMARGLIDYKAIIAAHSSRPPPAAEQRNEIPPPPPTVRSPASEAGADKPVEPAPQPPPPVSVVQAELPQPQSTGAPEAQGPAEQPGAVQAEAAPDTAEPAEAAPAADPAEMVKKLEAALDARSMPFQTAWKILQRAKEEGNAEEALYRFDSAVELLSASTPGGENPNPRIRAFFGVDSNADALFVPSRKNIFDRLAQACTETPASRPSPAPGPVSRPEMAHVNVANGDESVLQKIRQIPLPRSTIAFFRQQHNMDAHELIYVTLKIFRWLNGRQPADVKKTDYDDNIRRFGGDAQREVAAVYRRMTRPKHQTRIGLKSESELEPAYAEFMGLLKQVNYQLLNWPAQ